MLPIRRYVLFSSLNCNLERDSDASEAQTGKRSGFSESQTRTDDRQSKRNRPETLKGYFNSNLGGTLIYVARGKSRACRWGTIEGSDSGGNGCVGDDVVYVVGVV